MIDVLIVLSAFVLAFVVTLLFVPVAKQLALRAGIVDSPDAKRKLHSRVVPLSGGITLVVILPVVLGAALLFTDTVSNSLPGGLWALTGIALGTLILFVVGVADDRWGVRGRQKLLGQMVSAAVVLGFIYWQDYVQGEEPVNLFFAGVPAVFSFIFLFIWLIGAINAVNLIDGADGLASTVGAIAAAAVFLMIFISGNAGWESILAIALVGTLFGFLVYNFPPASTFLGDSGSMLIGLLIGSLAIQSSHKQEASIALFTPVAIIAIPFFDSFVAILRRRLTGRSIYTVDRGHLHHTLLERGLGPRGMLAVVAALCAISALGGVLTVEFHSVWPAIGGMAIVLGGLVVGRIFGFVEFQLLAKRVYGVSRSLVSPPAHLRKAPHQQRVRLQGSRNWDFLWEAITEFAEEHELSEVRLDLNLPWLHEGYHAVWHRRVDAEAHECWHTRLPLTGHGQTFGRLEISGPLSQTSVYHLLGVLAELLESMETVIVRLADTPDAIEEQVVGLTPRATQARVESARKEAEELAEAAEHAGV